ncbi:MAG: BON domain-containing protein [Acidobacteriota bacterium]|nr:BON domain-containing protein [Acidobacteriota bacterium]
MSYDEEQQRKSRVVVETPTSRREEVSYTHRERAPERSGYSTGMVAAVALTAIALTAFVLFFLMNREDATNANTTIATTAPTPIPTAQTPIIIQQPAQQPPVIIEQPATMQPAPVIITPPAPAPGTTAPPSTGLDDATIESQINKSFRDDPELSALGITVTVSDGTATLNGSVATSEMKSRVERLAKTVRGVRDVENKITVEP